MTTGLPEAAPRTRYLLADEVALMLRWNVDTNTAKRRLRNIPQSELPYIQIGRGRLYREGDVIHFIESRRVS